MDAKAKRILSRGLNKIFRLYSVSFQYALSPETTTDDDYGDDIPGEPTWVDNYEPLIAVGNSATAQVGNAVQQLAGGDAETYAFEWLSRKDLPVKTRIKYHDQDLEIDKIGPYLDQVGANLYFLQGRSDANDLSKQDV